MDTLLIAFSISQRESNEKKLLSLTQILIFERLRCLDKQAGSHKRTFLHIIKTAAKNDGVSTYFKQVPKRMAKIACLWQVLD